jgi:hypothetical protein
MKQVGHRESSLPSAMPSAHALRAAATHQQTGQALAALATTGIRKGVYRFATHADLNRATDEALARAIALNAQRRATR